MRRRELLALVGAGSLPALAGCGECDGIQLGVGFTVDPTALTQSGDGWRVDANLEVAFRYATEGSGMAGVSLAAFDATGAVVGTTHLGDLRWSAVPETERTETNCGGHGSLQREATVEADTFPEWVGIRYDHATSYVEPREIAVFRGEPTTEASADEYESVAVTELAPSGSQPTTSPPVESVSLRSLGLTCEPMATPALQHSSGLLEATHTRAVPEPHFRATLSGFEFGEVVQFEIGLGARPQLRRTDCTAVAYDVSVTYAETDTDPQEVELRHLDRAGEVTETWREPLGGTPTE